MTTEQIRKTLTVHRYVISEIGIYITYAIKETDRLTSEHVLSLTPVLSLSALVSIGSINRFEANPIKIWWETPKGTPLESAWGQFYTNFTLSQYEALTLAVRHEYEKSLANDMNLLEIDKALEALQ